MIKITKLTILIFLLFQNLYSQNKLKYTGSYENGNATYQYFENENYERVFDGNFEYTRNSNTKINGQFKNNKKIDTWNYLKKYKIKNEELSISINGKYNDGKKNGLWSYSKFYSFKGKIENFKFLVNVKNDTIIGNVKTPNLSGEIDEKGNFIGKWIYHENGFEYIAEFTNNILVKFIYRELKNNGKVFVKYTPIIDTLKLTNINDYNKSERLTKIDVKNLYQVDNGIVYEDVNNQIPSIFKEFFEKIKVDIYRFQYVDTFVQLESLKINNPEYLIENQNVK